LTTAGGRGRHDDVMLYSQTMLLLLLDNDNDDDDDNSRADAYISLINLACQST